MGIVGIRCKSLIAVFFAVIGVLALPKLAEAQDVCVTGAGDPAWNGSYIFDAGLNRWVLDGGHVMYQEFSDLVFRTAVGISNPNAYSGPFSGDPVGTVLSVGSIGTAPAPSI